MDKAPVRYRIFPFFAALIAGDRDAVSAFAESGGAEQEEMCRCAEDFGLGAFFYFYLAKEDGCLPEAWREKWKERFRGLAAGSLQKEMYRAEIEKLCEKLDMKFVPLKGWAVAPFYPHPALRNMSDLDVLLNREDAEKLYAHLLGKNWRKNEYSTSLHHLPMLTSPGGGKSPVGLEIHFYLDRRNAENGVEPMRDAVFPGGGRRGELPAALMLGALLEHAEISSWKQSSIKTLTDAVFLLRKHVIPRSEWEVFRERYHWRTDPDWLFGAFPEIFERMSDRLPGWPREETDKAQALRLILLHHPELVGENHALVSESGFAGRPLREKAAFVLRGMRVSPRTIRYKYHLRPDAKLALPYYYFVDYFRKAATLFRAGLRPDGKRAALAEALRVMNDFQGED